MAAARDTYLEAVGAAIFGGRLGTEPGLREVAEIAGAAPPMLDAPRPIDLLLDGTALRLTAGHPASVASLRRALHAFDQQGRDGGEANMHWFWLAWMIAGDLWDDELWHELATRAVQLARDAGALGELPIALIYRAAVHVYAGEFGAATGLIEESGAITAITGQAPLMFTTLLLAGWQGDEAAPTGIFEPAVANGMERGEGRALGAIGFVKALWCNGRSRYDEALTHARQACEFDDLGVTGFALVELIEAAMRSGANDEATAALARLEDRTLAVGTEWALGMLARSRALLSDGAAADELYREAIEHLGRTRVVVHLARAHLLYGEWLRRENRRLEARAELRVAYDMLSRAGAVAFAERARRELVATGETVRKRRGEAPEVLTAQETQIARLTAEGHTNQEIGSQLFISPRTVEYHLRKVFTKLGVRSRRELRTALTTVPA